MPQTPSRVTVAELSPRILAAIFEKFALLLRRLEPVLESSDLPGRTDLEEVYTDFASFVNGSFTMDANENSRQSHSGPLREWFTNQDDWEIYTHLESVPLQSGNKTIRQPQPMQSGIFVTLDDITKDFTESQIQGLSKELMENNMVIEFAENQYVEQVEQLKPVSPPPFEGRSTPPTPKAPRSSPTLSTPTVPAESLLYDLLLTCLNDGNA